MYISNSWTPFQQFSQISKDFMIDKQGFYDHRISKDFMIIDKQGFYDR